jgi:aspartyl-tRNA(Asn)/glutamyl-tRNA(Gln) amidotransferase subunit A
MTPLADLSLAEAEALVRRRALSPTELVEACLRRIEAVEPRLGAFALLDADGAMDQARLLTNELSSGRWRGPLHGIPLGVKDVIDIRGFPTRAGSRVLPETPADRDAAVTAQLRARGAIFMGKTTTHEFAAGVETPPTRNPWDSLRIPGGSSGGSAAAVAVGEVLGALGTDSGGSIRVPAALCGVSGFRPRQGTVSMDGVVPFSGTHDTCGPIARSVRDLIPLWEAMSGQRVKGVGDVRGIRVGIPARLAETTSCSEEISHLVVQAAMNLAGQGAEVIQVELPPFESWDEPRTLLVMAEFLEAQRSAGWYPSRRAAYGDEVREYLERASDISEADLGDAVRRLRSLSESLLSALSLCRVLLLPTTPTVAPEVGELEQDDGYGLRRAIVGRLLRLTAPIGSCRLPALSVPVGVTDFHLPVGMQIVGYDEETVLGVGCAFQDATDHHLKRPPILDSDEG